MEPSDEGQLNENKTPKKIQETKESITNRAFSRFLRSVGGLVARYPTEAGSGEIAEITLPRQLSIE